MVFQWCWGLLELWIFSSAFPSSIKLSIWYSNRIGCWTMQNLTWKCRGLNCQKNLMCWVHVIVQKIVTMYNSFDMWMSYFKSIGALLQHTSTKTFCMKRKVQIHKHECKIIIPGKLILEKTGKLNELKRICLVGTCMQFLFLCTWITSN